MSSLLNPQGRNAAATAGDSSHIEPSKVSAEPFQELFVNSLSTRQECPICGCSERVAHVRRSIRKLPLQFSRCTSCGCIYQDPIPSPHILGNYFSSTEFVSDGDHTSDLADTLGYYDYDAWDFSYRRTASIRLAHIRRRMPPPADMLEIGTATGSFLDEARAAGYRVRGLDISELLGNNARIQYGLDIETGFIEEHPLPTASFDVICAFGGVACWWNPVKALANIRQALRPNGVLVLNFSDVSNILARVSGSSYPEFNHASLVVYSNRTLQQLLAKAKFEILHNKTEWQYASLERIVTYWRSNFLMRVTRALRISEAMVRIPAVGTRLVICQPADSQPPL